MTDKLKRLFSISFELLQLRSEKRINAVELIRAEGIAIGQLGILTWTKYINKLLASREGQRVHRQNGQNNSKMEQTKG